MCGRDTNFYTWREIHAALSGAAMPVRTPDEDPPVNYNRAPTQVGWTIVQDGDGGAAVPMRWGLLPPWAKDAKLAYSTINARLETVTTKPAFRNAWKARRCLVPSSGYYEWMQLGPNIKQPYFIHLADAPVMFFAGLWESRPDGAGGDLLTYSIVTRDADQSIATLHDRMPLILPPSMCNDWLHVDPDAAMSLAIAAPPPPLVFHAVDRAVGNVRNTGAHLVTALPA